MAFSSPLHQSCIHFVVGRNGVLLPSQPSCKGSPLHQSDTHCVVGQNGVLLPSLRSCKGSPLRQSDTHCVGVSPQHLNNRSRFIGGLIPTYMLPFVLAGLNNLRNKGAGFERARHLTAGL